MMLDFKGQEFSMDTQLVTNLLSRLKEGYMANNWDCVGYICGLEGSGKTTLASQICAYLDPDFNLNRVAFNGKQFLEAVDKAKRGDAILFDEAYDTFENKSAWREETRIIKSTLTRIRIKGLYLIIVAPVFFEMSAYITIHRSIFMIHCDSKYWERGIYRLFNKDDKYRLYHEGYKWKNLRAVSPTFYGRFTKFFPLNQADYDAKKEAALSSLINPEVGDTKYDKGFLAGRAEGIGWLTNNLGLNQREVAEVSKVSLRTIHNWVSRAKESQLPFEEEDSLTEEAI